MRLQYEIAATGENQLRTVFRGIEREAQASNRRMAANAQRTAQQAAKASANPLLGGKAQASQTRDIERRLVDTERKRLREAISASRQEQRARLTHERELSRAKESLDKQRSRGLMQQFNAQERTERRALAARQATFRTVGRNVAGGAARGVGNVLRTGGAVAGIVGGIAIGSALAEETEVRKRASALANQAGDPSLKGKLASEAGSVKGFSGTETLGAMGAFVGKTGDLQAARAAIQDIGKLSLATNSDFETMGETAGNAFNVISDSIADPKKRLEALQRVMAGWAGQGNIGTVEMKDLAQFGGRLGGATRKFQGDPVTLLLRMGSMAQAAARAGGASDSAEATEGVARFAADLTKKPAQKALKGLGVNVWADKGKTHLKDPAQILGDILEKTHGNLALGEDIMNAQSGKVLGGFSDLYNKAEASKKGSGRAAVMAEFDRYDKAALTPGQVNDQSNSRLADPDLQFKEAMKAFNTAIGHDLLPAVTGLIPQFVQLAPLAGQMAQKLGQFLGWASENPWSGIGAIVAASVAKDVAASGIQAALSNGISGMLSSMTAGQIGMAKFAGAAAIAAASVYAAYDQNESLKKETGGKGILDVGWEWATTDKSLKDIADENLDKQAKAEAAARMTPGTVQLANGAPAPMPAGVPGAAGADPTASVAGQQNAAAANALQDAAKALKDAAAAMPKGGANGAPPNRTAPIIAPSRG